jgi:hypothetical protein
MIKVGVLNMRGALSSEENAQRFLRYVDKEKFDFASFPEAFDVGNDGGLEAAIDGLRRLGYEAMAPAYEDSDGRSDQRGILSINRQPMAEVPLQTARLVSRNAIVGGVTDPATNITFAAMAAHLDDRGKTGRMIQTKAALQLFEQDYSELPKIIGMDANDIRRTDRGARLLRVAGMVAKPFPAAEPRIGQNERSPKVIISKAKRAGEMALGAAIAAFEEYGFEDAAVMANNQAATAKFLGGLAKARLDHIMIAAPDFRVQYSVDKLDAATLFHTDHMPVYAQLQHFAVAATVES